jgi:Mn-dependent DtxR family transcriptional regulator
LSDQRLETLRARGWLEAQQPSEFRLTEKGRAQALSILRALRAHHATIQPMPASEMNRMEEMLESMVTAADDAATPPGTWCLTRTRRLAPPDDAAPTTKVDYYLSCLNAFRDDSHLAAWQAFEVSAEEWELFTSIWRSELKTLEELSTELAFRGQTREVYAAALIHLAAMGWIAETDGGYSLTAAGKTLREQVESTTDQLFAEAEAALTEPQAQELGALMAKLHAALSE